MVTQAVKLDVNISAVQHAAICLTDMPADVGKCAEVCNKLAEQGVCMTGTCSA